MVARAACRHAARTCHTSGHHAADRGCPRLHPEQWPVIPRLEGEHLPFARDECFDLGQWRARTHCEDKLGRVIVDDAHQPGRAEDRGIARRADGRSEEHTSELQSLMRISYAVFCLKKKNNTQPTTR